MGTQWPMIVMINIDQPSGCARAVREAAQSLDHPDRLFIFHHNLYHPRFDEGASASDEVLEEAHELLIRARSDQLEEIASTFVARTKVRVSTRRHAWQGLTESARSAGASLVISQCHQRARWQRWTMSNDDWQLIRHSPAPLWLVRDTASRSYRRVLAAIDPLHADDKPASLDTAILAHAAHFARRFDIPVDVLNVVAPVVEPMVVSEPVLSCSEVYREGQLEAHRAQVERLVAAMPESMSGDVILKQGQPVETLRQILQDEPDALLVMGAVSRTALSRLLIGHTAEKVLDSIACDVLIIYPEALGDLTAIQGSVALF